jgi:hypothetical protein
MVERNLDACKRRRNGAIANQAQATGEQRRRQVFGEVELDAIDARALDLPRVDAGGREDGRTVRIEREGEVENGGGIALIVRGAEVEGMKSV